MRFDDVTQLSTKCDNKRPMFNKQHLWLSGALGIVNFTGDVTKPVFFPL